MYGTKQIKDGGLQKPPWIATVVLRETVHSRRHTLQTLLSVIHVVTDHGLYFFFSLLAQSRFQTLVKIQ